MRAGAAAATGALASGLGGFYTLSVEPRWIETVKRTVKFPRLPPALNGLRICHLTDFHVGPYIKANYIARAIQIANGSKPDIVALTGDFVSKSARHADRCAQALGELDAALGVFAVLGNHDFWTDADYVAKQPSDVGVMVLRDAGVMLTNGLYVAGTEDLWEGKPDIRKGLAGRGRNAFTVLLQHNPDYFVTAAEAWYDIDVMLSGHTHGGQVNVPGIGPILVPSRFGKKYAAGLFREGKLTFYVNKGLGAITPPVRFNCRPEVAILTLKAA